MAAKTIIEINGRKYDALTGRIIEDGSATTGHKTSPVAHHSSGGVIDGFQKPKQKLHSSVSSTSQHHSHKKTQKSQTLARHIVKKPAPGQPQKATGPIEPAPRSLAIAETRTSLLGKTPKDRLKRAGTTKQSKAVTRFSSTNNAPKPILTPNLAVEREQVAQAMPVPSAAPPLAAHHTSNAGHHTKKQPFTHPLAGANSHLAAPPKKRRLHQKVADRLNVSSKILSASAACLAIIFLAGFFAYQRIPNVSMKVAASRAGFQGTIPSNTPAGYAFNGPITYEKDVIVLKYKSNSDTRQFQIVQRPSDWNSEALLKNFVSTANMRYQTYNDRGLTVYVMDKNNAAWVNKGIWYTLSGTNTLSTEQVLAMAASM